MRNPSEVVPIQMGVGIHYFRLNGSELGLMPAFIQEKDFADGVDKPLTMGVGIHYFRFEGFKSKIMAFRRVGEK